MCVCVCAMAHCLLNSSIYPLRCIWIDRSFIRFVNSIPMMIMMMIFCNIVLLISKNHYKFLMSLYYFINEIHHIHKVPVSFSLSFHLIFIHLNRNCKIKFESRKTTKHFDRYDNNNNNNNKTKFTWQNFFFIMVDSGNQVALQVPTTTTCFFFQKRIYTNLLIKSSVYSQQVHKKMKEFFFLLNKKQKSCFSIHIISAILMTTTTTTMAKTLKLQRFDIVTLNISNQYLLNQFEQMMMMVCNEFNDL
mgnify:CR=1 FL=1